MRTGLFSFLAIVLFAATWNSQAFAGEGNKAYRYWCEPAEDLLELEPFDLGLELLIDSNGRVEFYIGNPRYLGTARRLNWDGVKGYVSQVFFIGRSVEEINSFFASPVEIEPWLYTGGKRYPNQIGRSGSVYLRRDGITYEFICRPYSDIFSGVSFSF